MSRKIGIIFALFAIVGLVIFLVGGLYEYKGLSYGALNSWLGAIDFGKWVDKVEAVGPNIDLNDTIFDEFKNMGVDLRPFFSHINTIYEPVVIHYKLFLAGSVIFPISTLISLVALYLSKNSKQLEEVSKTSSNSPKKSTDSKTLELKNEIEKLKEKVNKKIDDLKK